MGYNWKSHPDHGILLRRLDEYGGLSAIPDGELPLILKWLVLCYIGEPGGYGAGINREVFYSNSAAPLIEGLLGKAPDAARELVVGLGSDKDVERACARGAGVARRYQELLDIVGA